MAEDSSLCFPQHPDSLPLAFFTSGCITAILSKEGPINPGVFVFHSIWEGCSLLFQPHFQWVDDTVIRIEQVQYEGLPISTW